mmetsp:Transcript_110742/g.319960  ORF Transcript_110742/g.319960 Transcript_110742/m.319960 type:complete len:344 (+) Transcript_110742:301-1332(+)
MALLQACHFLRHHRAVRLLITEIAHALFDVCDEANGRPLFGKTGRRGAQGLDGLRQQSPRLVDLTAVRQPPGFLEDLRRDETVLLQLHPWIARSGRPASPHGKRHLAQILRAQVPHREAARAGSAEELLARLHCQRTGRRQFQSHKDVPALIGKEVAEIDRQCLRALPLAHVCGEVRASPRQSDTRRQGQLQLYILVRRGQQTSERLAESLPDLVFVLDEAVRAASESREPLEQLRAVVRAEAEGRDGATVLRQLLQLRARGLAQVLRATEGDVRQPVREKKGGPHDGFARLRVCRGRGCRWHRLPVKVQASDEATGQVRRGARPQTCERRFQTAAPFLVARG